MFGRLRDGVSAEQAEREVETFTAGLRRQFPDLYPTHGWVAVETLQDVVVGRQVASSLWMILGVAGLVLVAAIANAGSLGLAELFVRHNELVVRQPLGATPLRIAGMLVLESVAQALLASAAGVGLAYAAVAWLRANASAFLPRAADLAIDPVVVAICVSIAVLSGAVIGMLPALRARKWSLVTNNRGIVSGRSRAQQVLVGVNVALSVVLLVGSTLILRSVRNLFATPAGFDAQNAIAFRMAVEGEAHDRFLTEARQVTGVESIALTSQLPFAAVRRAQRRSRDAGVGRRDARRGDAARVRRARVARHAGLPRGDPARGLAERRLPAGRSAAFQAAGSSRDLAGRMPS